SSAASLPGTPPATPSPTTPRPTPSSPASRGRGTSCRRSEPQSWVVSRGSWIVGTGLCDPRLTTHDPRKRDPAMTLSAGHILRLLGLLVEAASMFGILAVRRGDVGFWVRTGLDPSVVLTTTFVVGLGMWAAGWLIVRRERLRGRERDRGRPAGGV